MAKKRYTPETIIRKLREAKALQGQGETIAQVVKQLGITEQTFYRWRKEYGGMRVDQARHLKELEAENARLKQAVADLMVEHGVPAHIRSDDGPEMAAGELRDWLGHLGAKTAYIEPGSPLENGYCQPFNGWLRDELLNGEIFCRLRDAQVSIGYWRNRYNTKRPRSALGYRPPAPEVVLPSEGTREMETGLKAT